MMRGIGRSITFKWVLFSILLVTLPLTIAGVNIFYVYQKDLKESVTQIEKEKTARAVEMTKAFLERATSKLLFVARDKDITKGRPVHTTGHLKNLISQNEYLFEVALTDQNITVTPTMAKIGDIITEDDFSWKVLTATNLGDTLESDNMFVDPKKTSGKWISVRFEILNIGNEARYVSDPIIMDSQGNEFEYASEGIHFIPSDEYPFLEKLNPGITKTFTLIYDIPTSSNSLSLVIGKGWFDDGKSILLGI